MLRACAEGLDLCIVLPTFPLGPGDIGPTPTGKLVLDFLNGKMPAFADTAMNVVHVDDLGLGHLAALERGGRGRSCIRFSGYWPITPACPCPGCKSRQGWR